MVVKRSVISLLIEKFINKIRIANADMSSENYVNKS